MKVGYIGRTAGVCTLIVQGIASSCVGSDILDRQLECEYLLLYARANSSVDRLQAEGG